MLSIVHSYALLFYHCPGAKIDPCHTDLHLASISQCAIDLLIASRQLRPITNGRVTLGFAVHFRCSVCSDESPGCGCAPRQRRRGQVFGAAAASSSLGRAGRESLAECSQQCRAEFIMQCQSDELHCKSQSDQLRRR